MKTLYDIDVNPGLLWDHEFSPEEILQEPFFVWYLGRVLERGTAAEIKCIPRAVIAQHLERLRLSQRVRRFWQWYLNEA